jgi:nicotinate-nucleotide--dimethylbenzimidazole phosphoribosyltransferase
MIPKLLIPPIASEMRLSIKNKINNKTKPIGSLGLLEDIALQICQIQHTVNPVIENPHIVVFAGDHGIARTGLVNQFPQEVTAQMVLNFVRGGAAINVFCRQNNIDLTVVDSGVNTDFDKSLSIVHAKVSKGTKNYLEEAAMTVEEYQQAIVSGGNLVEKINKAGCNCIGFGEMGIGNTSAAALIMSAVMKVPIQNCVGKGTGANADQLNIKIETLEKVFQKHKESFTTPHEILRHVGGFEIAMMTGAFLRAASLKMILVVDGFIATSSFLLAKEMDAAVMDYAVFAHCSDEQGHHAMLNYLGVTPLLNLGMRLGEGTGAALAIPLLQSSVTFMNDMASFESAGVSERK